MPDDKPKTLTIYVAQPSATTTAVHTDDQAETHSLRATIGDVIGKEVEVPLDDVQDQWNETLDALVSLSDAIGKHVDVWKIDELEVGLTLSAKGKLMFIAEAGAEASIKVTLKPKIVGDTQ